MTAGKLISTLTNRARTDRAWVTEKNGNGLWKTTYRYRRTSSETARSQQGQELFTASSLHSAREKTVIAPRHFKSFSNTPEWAKAPFTDTWKNWNRKGSSENNMCDPGPSAWPATPVLPMRLRHRSERGFAYGQAKGLRKNRQQNHKGPFAHNGIKATVHHIGILLRQEQRVLSEYRSASPGYGHQ